ncbi:MAG: hypothetical protein ACJ8DN_12760, partial [Microvirga sp.]
AWERRQATRYALRARERTERTLSERFASTPEWFDNQPIEVWAGFDEDVSVTSDRIGDALVAEIPELDWFEVASLRASQSGKKVLEFSRSTRKSRFLGAYEMIDIKPHKTERYKGKMYYNHYCKKIGRISNAIINKSFRERLARLIDERYPHHKSPIRVPLAQFLAATD